MKYLKLFLLTIIAYSLQGCPGEPEDPDYILKVKNTSNEGIYIQSIARSIDIREIEFEKPYETFLVDVGETKDLDIWDRFLTDEKSFQILIYKKSTLDNYTWEEIQNSDLYQGYYKFENLSELQQINFELTFEGN
ncbi:hypothetical protein [Flavobacterium selenitireducens]|uniref:hypothetical protein n=1 Tax=Flavobacterium selenitireducens TaxID=2722704 RepID=UPI00168AF8F9|nr:hypothetical protein [Flavobacterium selenitireducens]MBD3584051.1 hypothetical protein [Flavobacterium selenitireducens]